MRGVGVEESAAVRAELLDRLLTCNGTERYDLLGAFERGGFDASGESLRHTQERVGQPHDDRQGE